MPDETCAVRDAEMSKVVTAPVAARWGLHGGLRGSLGAVGPPLAFGFPALGVHLPRAVRDLVDVQRAASSAELNISALSLRFVLQQQGKDPARTT